MEEIQYTEKPELNQPNMVLGFSGWLNGGEASTGVLVYLVNKLKATKFAELDAEDYHIYQVPGVEMLRPHMRSFMGVPQEILFPTNEFYYWKNEKGEGDLVLFLGSEPNLKWRSFGNKIMDVAQEYGVKRLHSVGGILDRSPHTREPRLFSSMSEPHLREEMSKHVMGFGTYEGPSSFTSMLHYLARERHIEAVSLSVRSPIYIQGRNPRAWLAVLERLIKLLDLELDLDDLRLECAIMDRRLDRIAKENPEVMTRLKEWEQAYDASAQEDQAPTELIAEDAIREAEDLLRHLGEESS